MGFYQDRVVPRVQNVVMNRKVEIGFGTGLNLRTIHRPSEESAPTPTIVLRRRSKRGSAKMGAVAYSQTCPRCGREFRGDDKNVVADEVVDHARVEHRHSLDREVVLAYLEGVHPHERDE